MKNNLSIFLLLTFLLASINLDAKGMPQNSPSFFSKAKMTTAIISPNGNYIATITNEKNGQNLNLINSENRSSQVLIDLTEFASEEASIGNITWLDNQNISVQFVDIKKGVENLLDTTTRRFLLVIKIPTKENKEPLIKSVRTKGWIVNPLIDKDDEFLYAKSGVYSKVYRIKPSKLSLHKARLGKLGKKDGAQFKKKNEVVSIDGYAVRWFFDLAGEVKAVLSYNQKGELKLNQYEEKNKNVEVYKWADKLDDNKKDDRLIPIALSSEKDTYYSLDLSEDEERSIYKVNYKEDKEQLVYESSTHQVVNVILAERSHELVGLKILVNGEVQNYFIDNLLSNENNSFKAKRNNLLKVSISQTLDKSQSIIYSESFNQPGQFFTIVAKKQQKRLIGSFFPHLDNKLKTRQIEGKVVVEGLHIPYLLNLPSNKSKIPLPLIVYPHGGPIGIFDDHYFDATSQYLNNKGFAVLRVNYRGSSGYSLKLKNAGKRQWGELILEDIVEATNKVSKRADIDSNSICILGMSYGGYAATMLTIFHPEIFKCGVNIAGVSDVNLYLNSPYSSNKQDKWMKEYIGDTVAEYEINKAISPVYHVNKLVRPLLVIHGKKDKVVDVEHAFRLKLMLEKYEKKFEWKLFEEQGHSMNSPDAMLELMETSVDFIARQLKK